MSDQGILATIRRALARRLSGWAIALDNTAQTSAQDEPGGQDSEPALIPWQAGAMAASDDTAIDISPEPGPSPVWSEPGQPPAHWLTYVRARAPHINWGAKEDDIQMAPQKPMPHLPDGPQPSAALAESIDHVPQAATQRMPGAETPDSDGAGSSRRPTFVVGETARPTDTLSKSMPEPVPTPESAPERTRQSLAVSSLPDDAAPDEKQPNADEQITPLPAGHQTQRDAVDEPAPVFVSEAQTADLWAEGRRFVNAWNQQPLVTLRFRRQPSVSGPVKSGLTPGQLVQPDHHAGGAASFGAPMQAQTDPRPFLQRTDLDDPQRDAPARALARSTSQLGGLPVENVSGEPSVGADVPLPVAMGEADTEQPGASRATAQPAPGRVPELLPAPGQAQRVYPVPDAGAQAWTNTTTMPPSALAPERAQQPLGRPLTVRNGAGHIPDVSGHAQEFSPSDDLWPRLPDQQNPSPFEETEGVVSHWELSHRLWRRRQRLEHEQKGRLWNGSLF